jgi:hypothetical protein
VLLKAAKQLRGLKFEVRQTAQLHDVKGFGKKMLAKVEQPPLPRTAPWRPAERLPRTVCEAPFPHLVGGGAALVG